MTLKCRYSSPWTTILACQLLILIIRSCVSGYKSDANNSFIVFEWRVNDENAISKWNRWIILNPQRSGEPCVSILGKLHWIESELEFTVEHHRGFSHIILTDELRSKPDWRIPHNRRFATFTYHFNVVAFNYFSRYIVTCQVLRWCEWIVRKIQARNCRTSFPQSNGTTWCRWCDRVSLPPLLHHFSIQSRRISMRIRRTDYFIGVPILVKNIQKTYSVMFGAEHILPFHTTKQQAIHSAVCMHKSTMNMHAHWLSLSRRAIACMNQSLNSRRYPIEFSVRFRRLRQHHTASHNR